MIASHPGFSARDRATHSRQGHGDKSRAEPGKYIVRVMSDNDGGEGFRIPVEYNVRSTLEFDVVPGRPNVFDIEVETRSESDESAFETGEARGDRRCAALHSNPRKDRTHARRPAVGCVVDPHLRAGRIGHCG
jgi:hypothetical protein